MGKSGPSGASKQARFTVRGTEEEIEAIRGRAAEAGAENVSAWVLARRLSG